MTECKKVVWINKVSAKLIKCRGGDTCYVLYGTILERILCDNIPKNTATEYW